MPSLKFLCVFVLLWRNSRGRYEIPDVIFEVYVPKGFRASIFADNDTEMFGFHGSRDQHFDEIEPGDFTGDVKVPQDGLLSYFNPELSLDIGDIVYYWVHVQHSQFGYRSGGRWHVDELKSLPNVSCKLSETKYSDRLDICTKTTIFEEKFDGDTLDMSNWIIEQYIPQVPDFEFVIYKDDPTVTYIKNGELIISPKLQSSQSLKEEILDLSPRCTKKPSTSGQCRSERCFIQNPVISGRIVLKHMISYGDIEIRAKLPAGDWMYPEIYLENSKGSRILIAYARGNKILTVGNNNEDIGGSLLLGGPISSHREPSRSSKLGSFNVGGAWTYNFHIYRLIWSKRISGFNWNRVFMVTYTTNGSNAFLDIHSYVVKAVGFESPSGDGSQWYGGMKLSINGYNYGDIPASSFGSDFTGADGQVRLVLGVGVGGISDFPDNCTSRTFAKPWINGEVKQVKNFFDKRAEWHPTWTDAALAVDYVKIRAV